MSDLLDNQVTSIAARSEGSQWSAPTLRPSPEAPKSTARVSSDDGSMGNGYRPALAAIATVAITFQDVEQRPFQQWEYCGILRVTIRFVARYTRTRSGQAENAIDRSGNVPALPAGHRFTGPLVPAYRSRNG